MRYRTIESLHTIAVRVHGISVLLATWSAIYLYVSVIEVIGGTLLYLKQDHTPCIEINLTINIKWGEFKRLYTHAKYLNYSISHMSLLNIPIVGTGAWQQWRQWWQRKYPTNKLHKKINIRHGSKYYNFQDIGLSLLL